jgi:hypothetical protein
MKQQFDAKDKERRAQKIAEKQNLEKRKSIRDRRYHVEDDEDELYDVNVKYKGKS